MSKIYKKLKSLLILSSTGGLAFTGICLYKGNESFYRELMPFLHKFIDPESAHQLTIKCTKLGLLPKLQQPDPISIKNVVFGLTFQNPIGLAGGFDKDAEAVNEIFKLGFGFVEVGSITPLPQLGNEQPRIFRLTEDRAIINRCGFNSKGHDYALNNLRQNIDDKNDRGIVGVSLGKNKSSLDNVQDYVEGVLKFGPVADYLVINISSPNTPGLRDLQEQKAIEHILDKVLQTRDSLATKKCPLLVKISADCSKEWRKGIANAITRKGKKIDGLIVSNTTTSRPETLLNSHKKEVGGLSGEPLKEMATEAIRDMYRLTNGQIPIIGVGGVFTGQDAYDKIKAGASLIQVYTALTFEGPPLVRKIKRELNKLLELDSMENIAEAVGIDHR